MFSIMLSHYNKYLEYIQKNNLNDNHNLDPMFVKYQKYKIKYQKLKKHLKNQNGGKSLGFYINVEIIQPKTIWEHPKLDYQTVKSEEVTIETNGDVKYKTKKIFNTNDKTHIISSLLFNYLTGSKIPFSIFIYEDINELQLNLKIVKISIKLDLNILTVLILRIFRVI